MLLNIIFVQFKKSLEVLQSYSCLMRANFTLVKSNKFNNLEAEKNICMANIVYINVLNDDNKFLYKIDCHCICFCVCDILIL